MKDSMVQAYFEQFSGHHPDDDEWWDVWAITYGKLARYLHREYRSEDEAQADFERLKKEYPDEYVQIEHIPHAGYAHFRFIHGPYFYRPITGFQVPSR